MRGLSKMMYGSMKASGGGTPVYVQSAKVMFVADGSFRSQFGWNTIDQGTTNASLVNQLEASVPWKITVPSSPDWDYDPDASNPGYGDFSSTSLKNGVYTTSPGAIKPITYSSLDNTKLYKLRVAALTGYDDPSGDMKTTVTVNGVAKELTLALGFTFYEVSFDVTGSSSITANISTAAGATYGFVCATILEEYTV